MKDILDNAHCVRRTFAPNGQVTSVTDANGNVTTFTYDTAGRLSSVIDAKDNSVSFTYDANGNVLTQTSTNKSDLGNPDTYGKFLADLQMYAEKNGYAHRQLNLDISDGALRTG